MVGISATSAQVLVVGDMGPQLEGELASHRVACVSAATANDAVTRMRATRFPFVVVAPALADMGGVDFIHGVLRHFESSVLLYGDGVDSSDINALLRTGRVAHFAANVEGRTVADFLAQRTTPTTTPVGAPAGTGKLLESPPPTPPAMSSIAVRQSQMSTVIDPQQQDLQRLEAALFDERARSNAELTSMRAQLGGLEQERAALLVEVEAGRRSVMNDVAWVMALSDEGSAVDPPPVDIKAKLAAALDDAARAQGELIAVRADRERLASDLASLSRRFTDDAAARDAAAAQGAGTNVAGADAVARAEAKMRADVIAARTDATTVRLDLQEALFQVEERSAALQSLALERDALSAQAAELREQLRLALEDAGAPAVLAPPRRDVELALARTRQLLGAIEPLMWGLTQAIAYYQEGVSAGGEAHLRCLQQLQGVLLRLRDEIAMLDVA
jgi:hypothetical protein